MNIRFERACEIEMKYPDVKVWELEIPVQNYRNCQAMKHMENNGRIVNFSTSVTGQMFPAYSVYAGTKGAVEQFIRQLAKKFGSKQITINAVAPGPVNTELFKIGKTEQQIDTMKKNECFWSNR